MQKDETIVFACGSGPSPNGAARLDSTIKVLAVDGNTVRPLLIEDDTVDQMAFARHVRIHKLPYDYTCVGSVNEARQVLQSKTFDAVVMDYMLGDGTAFDLMSQVASDTPVIIVTGAGHEEVAVKAMKAGADDYIIKDQDGRYLQILDLTVAAALRSKHAELALKQSEEEFRLTFENARDAIIWADPQTRLITRCNKAAEILLEKPRHLIVGSCYEDLHPSHQQSYYSLLFDRFVQQQGTVDHQAEIATSSGKITPVEIAASLTTVGGKAIFQGIFRDATERNRMETQLRQAQKMEALGTLAGGIAHDFNNILYVIIGYTELALEDTAEGTLLHSNLEQIMEAAQRAKDVVAQILTFSRRSEQERKPVAMSAYIREALKFLRASIPTTIDIKSNIDPDVGSVLIDPTQLHQILMNLCANAAHAMHERVGTLTVSLSHVELPSAECSPQPDLIPGEYARLSVADTGHGMTQQVLDRIFEPYFTTKKPGEGTGLGLAMVHGMVSSEGGTVMAQSAPGRGSNFHVYLPIIDLEASEDETSGKYTPLGSGKILLVDDELAVVRMAEQALRSLGYDVSGRTSSVEALELFRVKGHEFDLVITDLTMPNLTGVELAAELRKIRPEIPVIICTGFSQLVTAELAKNLGIAAVLHKPFSRSKMAQAIRSVLGS